MRQCSSWKVGVSICMAKNTHIIHVYIHIVCKNVHIVCKDIHIVCKEFHGSSQETKTDLYS